MVTCFSKILAIRSRHFQAHMLWNFSVPHILQTEIKTWSSLITYHFLYSRCSSWLENHWQISKGPPTNHTTEDLRWITNHFSEDLQRITINSLEDLRRIMNNSSEHLRRITINSEDLWITVSFIKSEWNCLTWWLILIQFPTKPHPQLFGCWKDGSCRRLCRSFNILLFSLAHSKYEIKD